jgi:serine/threonine protein kinase
MVGRVLAHYRLLDLIGAGGMGEVYRAKDERLDREVAVKVLPDSVAADPDRLARFEREAKALARLEHPNILTIHDFGSAEPAAGSQHATVYAVTELLTGETLRGRIARERLSWRRSVEIAAAIADGLASAHGQGIVHRDLKPENVFVTTDGRVKILDFGLAASCAATEATAETAPGAVLGTVGYMAPEQVQGGGVDARSDIFALGCVLFEMLAGQHIRAPYSDRNTGCDRFRAGSRTGSEWDRRAAGSGACRHPLPGEAAGRALPVGERPGVFAPGADVGAGRNGSFTRLEPGGSQGRAATPPLGSGHARRNRNHSGGRDRGGHAAAGSRARASGD